MNTKAKRLILPTAMALCALTVAIFNRGDALSAAAANQPQVIEIKAKKFEFTPTEITLKKGEPVILRLTSEDRTHGFFVKPFNIDVDIKAGESTDVAVTPEATGEYVVICDHYCGIGHGNMKMKLTVVQ